MERNTFNPDQLRWIEALESGVYRKTRNQLSRGPKLHCCLGVACRVLYGEPGEQWELTDDNLPDDAVDRLHVHNEGGLFAPGEWWREQRALHAVNDDTPTTFKQIAAEMRKRPWLFFTNFDKPADAA